MMRFWKFLFLVNFLLASARMAAQPPEAVGTESLDSLISLLDPETYDSLMQELDFFLGTMPQKEKNYFDVALGAGNGFFTKRDNPAGTTVAAESRFVLMPSAGYYLKNGLGLSWFGFVRPDDKSAGLYQHQVSLSYDYIKGKKIGFGISYGRQFAKDSTDFYPNPFKNTFSGYVNMRKGWLRPGLQVSYSTGGYTDYLRRAVGGQVYYLRYNVDLKDITVMASVKHQFVKQKLFSANDYFVFTPRLLLISSGQQFVTNSPDTRLRRLISNGFLVAAGNTGFQPQSLGLSLSADYFLKGFYIHPQVNMDYFLQQADRRMFTTVLLVAGVVL